MSGGLLAAGRIGSASVNIQQIAGSDTSLGTLLRGTRVVSRQIYGFVDLVGREGEVAALQAAFTGPGRLLGAPVVRVLTGLGGVGKTSLARAYAYRHQSEYGLIWWVRAEDPKVVPSEFRRLLSALGVPASDPVEDPVQDAHTVLANRDGRWLLVYDNAVDAPSLSGLLPPAGHGDVLVTSRAAVWPDRRQVLPVAPLRLGPAVELLIAASGDPDRTAARDLAAELGALPLALQQAASYVAESAGTLAGYLRLYQRQQPALQREGNPPDYDQRVATTWRVAFQALPAGAQALLNLLAWYAPEAIPLDLLLPPGAGDLDLPESTAGLVAGLLGPDQLERDHAIAALRRYSLIDVVGPQASVHRLVQAVTRDQLHRTGEAEAWAATAGALLHAAIPHLPTTARTLQTWQRLAPHFRRNLALGLQPDSPQGLTTRHDLANFLGDTGDSAGARDMLAALLADEWRVLGVDDPRTLFTRHDLASQTGEAGDAIAARDLFAALLPDQERVLGADHPDTLDTRDHLAMWTGEAGNPVAARDLLAALVPDQQRVLGVDHPDTLATRRGLARLTGEAGEPAAARDLLTALLPLAERTLGNDHPEVLRTQYYLARWTAEAGDPAVARDLFFALLIKEERVLGADHRFTLFTRHGLAQSTGHAGDATRARDLLAVLLTDQERVLGGDQPDTLSTRHSLARWTGEAGDPVGARDQLAAVLPDRQRVLGPDHPDTLNTRYRLAVWTGKAGDTAAARDLLAALLQDRERVLGADHPLTLITRSQLRYWAGQVG